MKLWPSPFWLGLTSFFTYYPQNQKFVEQQGEQCPERGRVIYNGPYTLTQFEATQGATMVKNDDYWMPKRRHQRVEMPIVKETDTAVNLYESGELDNVEIDSEYVDEYRSTRPTSPQRRCSLPGTWSSTELADLPEHEHAPGLPNGLQRGGVGDKISTTARRSRPGTSPSGWPDQGQDLPRGPGSGDAGIRS